MTEPRGPPVTLKLPASPDDGAGALRAGALGAGAEEAGAGAGEFDGMLWLLVRRTIGLVYQTRLNTADSKEKARACYSSRFSLGISAAGQRITAGPSALRRKRLEAASVVQPVRATFAFLAATTGGLQQHACGLRLRE